jgi:hypothetical protein
MGRLGSLSLVTRLALLLELAPVMPRHSLTNNITVSPEAGSGFGSWA